MKASLIKALYVASYCIARSRKNYNEGTFLKSTAMDMLRCFGDDGKYMAELISAVPLSKFTVNKCIEKISKYFEDT